MTGDGDEDAKEGQRDPEGATSVGSGEPDPSKMLSYYDLDEGTSLVRSVFGVNMWGSNRGPSYSFLRSLEAPFSWQVIRDTDDRWVPVEGQYPTALADAVFGNDSKVVDALRDNATSLADLLLGSTLGSPDYVSAIREASVFSGNSLCGILFGSEESLSDYLGEFPFVSLLDRIVALESKVAELENAVSDIQGILASHASRLAAGGL